MSSDTDSTSQPHENVDEYEPYDDLDDGAGCVEIWEYIESRRED